jgi:hypothetical protein
MAKRRCIAQRANDSVVKFKALTVARLSAWEFFLSAFRIFLVLRLEETINEHENIFDPKTALQRVRRRSDHAVQRRTC